MAAVAVAVTAVVVVDARWDIVGDVFALAAVDRLRLADGQRRFKTSLPAPPLVVVQKI